VVTAPATVIDSLDRGIEAAIDDLAALARVPSVSAQGFDPAQLVRSAELTADLLAKSGLERVEILTLPGVHPYVVAEWLHAGPDAPTVLVYAHHDVQPPGRAAYWRSPPFEPTRRENGRLYGRGVVDDKAGVLLHLAAQRAWLAAEGALPVNVKWIVEGEEETGSEHLAEFLRAHRARLDCDVLVLSDTANLDTGIPSLTTSLRGIVQVDVTVRALDHPIHSGMWGGPVPDAATAMTSLLARLVDDQRAIAVPGIYDDAPELSREERDALAALPFDAAAFRRDAGMNEGAAFIGERNRTVYERIWYRPALALTALEGMPLATAANQLMAEARARVEVRVAPGQNPDRIANLVADFAKREAPAGLCVETSINASVPGWKTRAEGPAFDAARRALRAGYGRDAVAVGCGGSIPFVGPFVEVLGGVPALLLGLEDPPCNAHGENESLDLADFAKAAHSSAHLLAELRGFGR
jgi:acetylornithine deacetylase/succinyl-diaminopimelate desuccinylase-like protein